MNLDAALNYFLNNAPNLFTPTGAIWLLMLVFTIYFLIDWLQVTVCRPMEKPLTDYDRIISNIHRKDQRNSRTGFILSLISFFMIWIFQFMTQ